MKKHYTLFAIIAFIVLTGIAQDEPRQSKQFYIGVFASPDLSFGKVPYPDSYFLSASNPNSNYNISKYSYTLGLEALYQINTRLALSIGLQYSDKGGKTKLLLFPATPAPLPDHYKYNYRFFDIPVRIDYYFSRKKIAPFITTGVSTNVFLNQSTKGYFFENTVGYLNENSTGYSKINLQFQIGAGVDITFNKSRLRIFPIYRVSIIKPNLGINTNYYYSGTGLNPQISGRLYSIGLGINYFFRLSKRQTNTAPNDMREL